MKVSGSPPLNEIQATRGSQLTLKNQTKDPKSLKSIKEAKYYSSWQFAAVHVALSIPDMKNEQVVSRYLGIPVRKVKEIIEALAAMELIRIDNKGKTELLQNTIHLDRDSDIVSRHHTNWRLQAIRAIECDNKDAMHYSSIITASHEDAVRIKAVFLEAIDNVRGLVKASKDEAVFSYAVDFFPLGVDSTQK